jgi:hypothetical protein
MEAIERRNKAVLRNYFTLNEMLKKSTQAWTSKLTGIQHWKPETGYDVFVFDPNELGDVYVLFRRWNEDEMTCDEVIKKHPTGHGEPANAVQAAKDWVSLNWDDLKEFKADSKEETDPKPESEITEENNEHKEEIKPTETPLEQEIAEAVGDNSVEKDCQFENFLDNGIQTEDDKETAWKTPWLKRINTQLKEMGKDYSQYERTMQQRRDNALEKSLHRVLLKLDSVTAKIKG